MGLKLPALQPMRGVGMHIKCTSVLLLICGYLSACSQVNSREPLPDLERLTAERGIQKVHWRGDPASDLAVDKHTEELLQGELTEEKAIQIALYNNRNLQATFESLGIAQADLVAAGLLSNPVLDAEIRFFKGSPNPGAELGLVQNFLDIFFIPLRTRIAESALEAEKLRVTGAVIDLAFKVKVAFREHLAARQALELRGQILNATEGSYTLAKELNAAGNLNRLELANERALFEQSKLSLRAEELKVVKTREDLNDLLGLWGKRTDWKVKGRLPEISKYEQLPDSLEKTAIEKSLDLQALRLEIDQALQRFGIALPSTLLNDAALGVSSDHESEGDWGLGPAFTVPLPLFNQGEPVVAVARATLRALRERYMALAVTIRARVRSSYAALLATRDTANYYREVLLPLREEIVDRTQLQYNAMQVGAFQLLQAKQQQIDAGSSYVEALESYWIAEAELQQLLNGRLIDERESSALGSRNEMEFIGIGG